MTNTIGRIALQPAIVRPGEPVRVEVFDNDDNPLNVSAQVSINGVPGALQFLQFPTVGQRRLIVHARAASGVTDRQVALLDVAGAPLEFPSLENRSDIAMIGVTQLPTQPYTAVLTLGSKGGCSAKSGYNILVSSLLSGRIDTSCPGPARDDATQHVVVLDGYVRS